MNMRPMPNEPPNPDRRYPPRRRALHSPLLSLSCAVARPARVLEVRLARGVRHARHTGDAS